MNYQHHIFYSLIFSVSSTVTCFFSSHRDNKIKNWPLKVYYITKPVHLKRLVYFSTKYKTKAEKIVVNLDIFFYMNRCFKIIIIIIINANHVRKHWEITRKKKVTVVFMTKHHGFYSGIRMQCGDYSQGSSLLGSLQKTSVLKMMFSHGVTPSLY